MSASDSTMADLLSARTLLLFVLACGFSELACAEEVEQGVEFSIFGADFFGGDSGPTVVSAPIHPETKYSDTFGTGFGLTAQYFRQMTSVFRWQVGLIYQSWPGEFFEGGEFQPGWAFGAGGQFDDLRFAGIYGGLTLIRQPGPKLRPFAAIDLAIVDLSGVDVVVSGVKQPYWKNTTKDYLIMKAGLAWEISPRATLSIHAGFSTLGKPESVDVFSSATAGSSIVLGVGAGYEF